jgi:ribosomal protein L21
MFKYAVCEINGKQVKVLPNKPFDIDLIEGKNIKGKVLMLVGDKVEIGTPHLKDELTFEVLGNRFTDKIRVSKFHAKANYRRTTGSRKVVTTVVYKA